MINDVIKRLSREHTLVINERTRDDPNLPTDLWKKPVANISLNLHIVIIFISTSYVIFCEETYCRLAFKIWAS